MNLGLSGKVALITGASRGIGYAIAERLAEEGAQVAIASRGRPALVEAARSLEAKTGTKPFWQECDLSQAEQVESLVESVNEKFGRIDMLVVSAGAPRRGKFQDFSDEEWRRSFEVAALGVARIIRLVLPTMEKQGAGSILTITSSSVKQPIKDQWLSNMLRPGVWGLVKSLALDLAPQNIRVNNIAPGRILTERVIAADERKAAADNTTIDQAQASSLTRVPMGRFGKPEEIADAAAFLLSDRASYITGNSLHVDGGMVRSL